MTIPALSKIDTGFQFPARLNTYCSAGVKKGLFIFVCEFVHYVPARRKNAISILSAYYEHFRGLLAVSVPGTSIGVDLTLGHLKQLFGSLLAKWLRPEVYRPVTTGSK
jgi:hypothetical protein